MQWFKIDQVYNKDLIDIMVIINNSINKTIESFHSDTLLKDKIHVMNSILEIDSKKFNLDQCPLIGICGIGKAVITTINYLYTILKPSIKPWAIIPEDLIVETREKNINIDLLPGNHPLPSGYTFQSTKEFLKKLSAFSSKDLIILVISGGASSLFALPDINLSVEEYIQLNSILIYSGKPIKEINEYRKLIDNVKGGELVNFIKATIIGLYISDVVGDDIAAIGSGTTIIPDTYTYVDITTFPKFTTFPLSLQQKLRSIKQQREYTNKHVHNIMLIKQVAFAEILMNNLQTFNQKVIFCPETFYEDYQVVVQKIVVSISAYKQETLKEMFFLWTGESTVNVKNLLPTSIGGRNQHLLLYLYKTWLLKGLPEALLITLATDGKDGNSGFSGGWLSTRANSIYPNKLQQVLEKVDSFLNTFNSSGFLLPNNVFNIGPTGLNFADIILIYVF